MFSFRKSSMKMKAMVFVLVLVTITFLRYNKIEPRSISINLGDGKCEWTSAIYNVPETIPFFKTLIAGYPSGDKRLTFIQMEALTGLSSRDEWDFKHLGITNQPFVKANYPHHEGIDGWKGVALGQVAMVVRNIKRSLTEYHDILWDIGYAQTFDEAYARLDNLYQERPPLADFIKWRNLRIFDEIHWYSWFIDYYMESGLMRDMFTHEITTPEHWRKLILPNHYTKEELRFKYHNVETTPVTPSYDPMCATITSGCYPVRIISGEKLVAPDTGPTEGRKIAELIYGKEGFDEWMIDEEAWECIWNKLIINKKGLKTFIDRGGLTEHSYDFTFEMTNAMWYELERLITKYGVKSDQVAQDLVALLTEHQQSLDITPDPSKRMSYEEIMTYQLAFEPFFPDQKPFTHHTDAYFPKQKAFNSSKYDRRMLEKTDGMGSRTNAEYDRRIEMDGDVVFSEEHQKSNVVLDENRKLDINEKSPFFKRADEILRQRRLNQVKSMKDMHGF